MNAVVDAVQSMSFVWYQPSLKSFHSEFSFATSSSFHARRHCFIRFSCAMAPSIVGTNANHTSCGRGTDL